MIFLETPPPDLRDVLTPVGLLALAVSVTQVVIRYFQDRPKMKQQDAKIKELEVSQKTIHEENIGLQALVKQRYDFAAAVDAMRSHTEAIKAFMGQITDAMKTGETLRGQYQARIEASELKQSQEHRAITDALAENTRALREIHNTIQGQRWDGHQERRR